MRILRFLSSLASVAVSNIEQLTPSAVAIRESQPRQERAKNATAAIIAISIMTRSFRAASAMVCFTLLIVQDNRCQP